MKRIACCLVSAALTAGLVAIPASAASFSDVEGHWGQSAIQQVTEWNLFSGTGENTFSPDLEMTRGMFVTVMAQTARMLQVYQQPTQAAGFADVSDQDYYAESAAWAKENGLVAGVDESHFAPNVQITREQMCVIMTQFLTKFTDHDLSAYMGRDNKFLDKTSIHDYAVDSVNLCVTLGLVSGVPVSGGVEFQPQQPATRAAVAVVLEQLVSVTKQLPELPEEPEEEEEEEKPGGGGGAQSDEEHTEEEIRDEAQMAEYLQIMLDSYKTSTYLPTTDQEVQDCMAILMDCVSDALSQRDNGQFLDRAYVQSHYTKEIDELRAAYDALTEEQLNQINNVIVRLAKTEQIYFVMNYFGVDYME